MFNKQNLQQELKNKISKIKEYFKIKNSKRQELANRKGKLLIEMQIIEENKRKIEENYEIFKDQIREMEENVDNKEEYIKMFEKKLREVEIYVQKNTKNLFGTKYDIYKNFIMNDFINENTDLLKKKETLENERIDYIKQVEEAKVENLNLKKNVKVEEEIDFGDGNNFNANTESGIKINEYNLKSNNDLQSNRIHNTNLKKNDYADENAIVNIISSRINHSIEAEVNNLTEGNKYAKTVRNNISIYTYNNSMYNSNVVKKQNSEKLKKNNKIKNLLKQYNNHIKLIESKNKLLRVQMKDLQNKFLSSKLIFLQKSF